jgi:uncharacterized protein YlxW (UPF0749 family)
MKRTSPFGSPEKAYTSPKKSGPERPKELTVRVFDGESQLMSLRWTLPFSMAQSALLGLNSEFQKSTDKYKLILAKEEAEKAKAEIEEAKRDEQEAQGRLRDLQKAYDELLRSRNELLVEAEDRVLVDGSEALLDGSLQGEQRPESPSKDITDA